MSVLLVLKKRFGEVKIEQGSFSGEPVEVSVDCPYCFDTNKNLVIHIKSDNKFGIWHCWVCKAKGYISELLKDFDQNKYRKRISEEVFSSFFADLNLKKESPVSTDHTLSKQDSKPNFEAVSENSQREIFLAMPKEAENLPPIARLYLEGRGISTNIKNLAYCKSGFYSSRIIFPIKDFNGKHVSFSARTIIEQKPKYLFPKYHPNKSLFKAETVDVNKPVFLVEGPLDACQTDNSVALGGKSIKNEQLIALYEAGVKECVFCLDSDVSFIDDLLYNMEKTSKWIQTVKTVLLTHGDPGSLPTNSVYSLPRYSMMDLLLKDTRYQKQEHMHT